MVFEKLKKENNSYYITQPRNFIGLKFLTSDCIQMCFEFSYDMTFGLEGQHRNYRSGGSHNRKNGEIFINTFQGKLAEFAFYNLLNNYSINCQKPDTSKYELGRWDSCDFVVRKKKINIKSTKYYGNLLLLEEKDWNTEGVYLPNYNTENISVYDYFILLRLKPSGEELMKMSRALYSNSIDRNILQRIIDSASWEFDIPGFCTLNDFKLVIKDGFIIPKGGLLNGKTKMDADNFYLQAGDLKSIEEIIKILK